MEKPGMDRRFPLLRSGLLRCAVLILRLLYPPSGYAQSDEEETGAPPELTIAIQTDPENPSVDSPWILTFLVDHPAPSEVSIHYPPLPGALALESIRTGSRTVESRRWTAIEFWFIPQRPGTVTLKPFEIITPDTKLFTQSISGYIEGTSSEYRPHFSWGTLPRSLAIGEPYELTLRLSNRDPRKPLPSQELLREEPPEQVILEMQPLTEPDREQGIVLRLTVIPLGGQEFILKPLPVHYEGQTLEIPGISIPLSKADFFKKSFFKKEPEAEIPETEIPETGIPEPDFLKKETDFLKKEPEKDIPEIPVKVFPLFRSDYERALEEIRRLWETGQIPEALAEIRRNEREHSAGPQFVLLRREMERRLGFDVVYDERWRPRRLWRVFCLASFTLLVFTAVLGISKRLGIFKSFLLRKKKNVTSRFSWGYNSIVIILLVLLTAALFSLRESMPEHRRETGTAILRTADAYRVPDEGSGINARFSEGQPVIIRSVSDSWVYAESFDGRFGWVLRDKIIVY